MKCRTCPEHRKAEQVVPGPGAPPARFCQKVRCRTRCRAQRPASPQCPFPPAQCGRFHALALFEGPKRSCTDSLREHNQRQRRLRRLRLNSLGRGDDDLELGDGSASLGGSSSGGSPVERPAERSRFSAFKPALDATALLHPDTWGAAAGVAWGEGKGAAPLERTRTDDLPLPPWEALEDRLEDWSAQLHGFPGAVTARRLGSGLLSAPSQPLVTLPSAFDMGPF